MYVYTDKTRNTGMREKKTKSGCYCFVYCEKEKQKTTEVIKVVCPDAVFGRDLMRYSRFGKSKKLRRRITRKGTHQHGRKG